MEVRRNTGVTLYAQQFQALLIKRFVNTLRSIALSIAQILVPVIFTVLALVFLVRSKQSEKILSICDFGLLRTSSLVPKIPIRIPLS